MQHFRVKLFAEPGSRVEIASAIPVFHRWIQKQALDELLIDVADYGHIEAGPGVLLMAHDAFYSLDNRGNRLGLLYNRRTVLDGSTADRLRSAIEAARKAARLLEGEPEFAASLRFRGDEMEISVNDRALAPNTDETWEALRPELAAVLDGVWGPGSYTLTRAGEPGELFTVKAIRTGV